MSVPMHLFALLIWVVCLGALTFIATSRLFKWFPSTHASKFSWIRHVPLSGFALAFVMFKYDVLLASVVGIALIFGTYIAGFFLKLKK